MFDIRRADVARLRYAALRAVEPRRRVRAFFTDAAPFSLYADATVPQAAACLPRC